MCCSCLFWTCELLEILFFVLFTLQSFAITHYHTEWIQIIPTNCISVKTVVLNVPLVGVVKFWWGVEVEDIMKQFWWETNWKCICLQSNWFVDIKLVQLFTPIGPQFRHVICAFFHPQVKLSCKNFAPKLHEILFSVIKCTNSTKANAKAERLFQMFCEANHADHRQWHNKKFEPRGKS